MSTQGLNGTAEAESHSDPLEAHIRGLEELLVPLRAERDQLKARLTDLSAREKAIAHAVGALRGGPPQPAKPKPAKPAASTHTWTPSEERLKSLFELIVAEPDPISPTQLSGKTKGLGVESASKGFKILRDRELIRVTGALRGGGNLYAPMPGAEWPS